MILSFFVANHNSDSRSGRPASRVDWKLIAPPASFISERLQLYPNALSVLALLKSQINSGKKSNWREGSSRQQLLIFFVKFHDYIFSLIDRFGFQTEQSGKRLI